MGRSLFCKPQLKYRQFFKFVLRIALYTFLGWVVLAQNPFGISDRADEATQDAFYRILSPLYRSKAQDDIVVVLLNDRGIRELYERELIAANEWPIQYQDHGYLLGRIMKYRPRALFVDIYFKQERSTDPTYESFSRRVGRAGERSGTRLLFASGYAGEPSSEIQRKLGKLGDMVVNGWSGYGRGYPLRDRTRNTAAFELYRSACLEDNPRPSCEGELVQPDRVDSGDAISVRWGMKPAGTLFGEFTRDECLPGGGVVSRVLEQLARGGLKGLYDLDGEANPDEERCPYHAVLYADDLVYVDKLGTEAQKAELKRVLEDRLVLYGLDLEGLHDRVTTPVHGSLPGVYLHAMALDNLMYYGTGYTRASNDEMDRLNMLMWTAMVVILCVVLYFLEREGVQMTGSAAPGRGIKGWLRDNPRTFVMLLFSVLITVASVLLFWILNYEPVNSLGFFALSTVVAQLVHKDIVDRLISWLERVRKRLWV